MQTRAITTKAKQNQADNSLDRKTSSSARSLPAVPVSQFMEEERIESIAEGNLFHRESVVEKNKGMAINEGNAGAELTNEATGKIAVSAFQFKAGTHADANETHQPLSTQPFYLQQKSSNISNHDLPFQQDHYYSTGSLQNVFQLRGENPYNTAKAHDGWELTAHHIIAHTKIVEALDFLKEDQKKEILIASIPAKITASMLENVKVVLTPAQKKNVDKSLAAIRARLVDKEDNEELNSIKINDVRQSFFEWQSGNQFYGPNTAIRAEPGASKDDIDTDGQYFNKTIYKALKNSGDSLYGVLGKKKKNEILKSQLDANTKLKAEEKTPQIEALKDSNDVIKDELFGILKKMVSITKDVEPAEFDPNQWVEIKSLEYLESLSKNRSLDRSHIIKYAFFRIPFAEWESGKYEYILATNAGRSEFKFAGAAMKKTKLKGNSIFVPIEDSKSVKPGDKSSGVANLYEYLKNNNTMTSSYLPKSLPLMEKTRIPLLKQMHTNSIIEAKKYRKEVTRLNTKKTLTPNESKRLSLFTRKYDSASQSIQSSLNEIARIESLKV